MSIVTPMADHEADPNMFLPINDANVAQVEPTAAQQAEDLLFLAIDTANVRDVEQLIGEGVDINRRYRQTGNSPLEFAIRRITPVGGADENVPRVRIAELLMTPNNVNTVNDMPFLVTPLHLTMQIENRFPVVELLIRTGANIEARDLHRDTPLHYAVVYRNVRAARLLIENGADLDSENEHGTTPRTLVEDQQDPGLLGLLYEWDNRVPPIVNGPMDITPEDQSDSPPSGGPTESSYHAILVNSITQAIMERM
jgi:Ankyrin repeats (3 copies)